jgi:hypothetical protein
MAISPSLSDTQCAVTVMPLSPSSQLSTLHCTIDLMEPLQFQQVTAMDNRHVLLLGKSQSGQSQLHVLTRRGQRIGHLPLAIPIRRLAATAIPYRYLALTETAPTSALILDLKPFRVLPLKLSLEPALMAALDWGYLFANRHGQFLLLDRDAHLMGSFAGPTAPTALAPLNAYEVVAAAADQITHLNLKQAPVELLG